MISEKKLRRRILEWEKWPFPVIYAPLIFFWIYYAIRARAFWFMSNVDPTLEFSGLEGEPKMEMYIQLPLNTYPKTFLVTAGTDFQQVLLRLQQSGIKYPFIVKPDIGMQGLLFRKIEKEAELFHYNNYMQVDYVVQDLVDLPLEFSVFHIRYPGQDKGKITGFIQKEYMFVTGDGKSNLLELILQHPKAKFRLDEMKSKHGKHLSDVFAEGEKYTLSIAGNHNRGARFIHLDDQVDQRLLEVFDNISLQTKHFYYGRYDVKAKSVEELKAGKFSILEFNGVGAEPNHIYDCGISYDAALSEIIAHWHDMYKIGRINKRNGYTYWSFWRGYKYMRKARKFFDSLRDYDMRIEDHYKDLNT